MSNDKTHELVQKAYVDVARKQSFCCRPGSPPASPGRCSRELL
jgi:hypothetical protein